MHLMTVKGEWWTIKSQITLKTTILCASVFQDMKLRNGFQAGLQRPSMTLLSLNHGSLKKDMMRLSLDQSLNLTGIGPTMLQELNWDAFSLLVLLENFQLRTSMSDVGLPTSTCISLSLKDLEEVWDTQDQLYSTITSSIQEQCWTTQIYSGGTSQEHCQETLQFQMLIKNGELDKIQYSINTTRHVTDTEWENQDMYHGMDQWINQLCHISLIKEPMSSTVLSRRIATPLLNSSEQ